MGPRLQAAVFVREFARPEGEGSSSFHVRNGGGEVRSVASLQRTIPMFDYNSFRRFDRVFDDVMGATFGTATHPNAGRAFSPSIDVFSDDTRTAFVADVPGVRTEDLDVSVEGRVLTIRGGRKFVDPSPGKKTQALLGRSYGTFSRSYTLPDDLDVSRLSAELSDGVLTISIPKLEASKPRRVQIAVKSEVAPSASAGVAHANGAQEGAGR